MLGINCYMAAKSGSMTRITNSLEVGDAGRLQFRREKVKRLLRENTALE
jgi:hypothetical protein